MKYFFCLLSITLFSPIFIHKSFAATQDVIINEIGASEGTDYEWVEIYNRGVAPIDLANWKFVENFTDSSPNGTNHNLNFSGATILDPSQYALIAQDAIKFKEKYPNFTGLLIDSSWSTFNESGEKIGLKDADGNFSELFAYIEAKNFSLERKNPNLNDYTGANWQEHPSGNTVGAKNYNSADQTTTTEQTASQEIQQTSTENTISSPPTFNFELSTLNLIANAGENIIALTSQEIIFDASGSQGNIANYEWNFGDGRTSKEKIAKHKYDYAGKYIVILTISDGQSQLQDQITASIYPSGVHINEFLPSPQGTDSENEWIEIRNANNFPVDLSGWILNNNSKSFSIPQNTFISPQSYLVLPRKTTNITLTNANGLLKFSYPENIPINEIKYDKTKEDYSASKRQDDHFVWTKNSTPGAPNIISSENTNAQNIGDSKQIVSIEQNKTQNLTKLNQKFMVINGGFIVKNLISAAEAHHVEEEIISENNSGNKSMASKAEENLLPKSNLSANIGSAINSIKNAGLAVKIIFILAIAGIFVLMRRVVKKTNH